jgi:hypothetical protein
MKDIADATFGHIKSFQKLGFNADSPGAKLYRQLQAEGGTTGGFALFSRQKKILDVEKLRKINRSNPRKAWREVAKVFDNYNAIFEDATRLSVYKESLARGLSREQAAVFAKEATINFNRKGTLGAHTNALYAFANASIQGSTKILKVFKDNPKVAAAVTSAVTGGVLMQTMINDAFDPDWREKVAPWERNNNLVIVLPPGEKGEFRRILLPVSWGIKPIKTMADYAVDLAMGVDRGSAKDITMGIVGASLDAYNPLGGSNIRQAFTPTIADAAGDIWMNEGWTGRPIKPDRPFYPNLPEHQKYFQSIKITKAGRISKSATDYFANNGGIRISPNTLKYAVEQFTGGAGRTVVQTFNTALSLAKPTENDVNEIPVVNRFFKSTPKKTVDNWIQSKRLSAPTLKKAQEKTDEERWERSEKTRDALIQYKEAKTGEERSQIRRDLLNQDPKAYKALLRRIKDDRRGIDYHTSVLKDLSPEFRADQVLVELQLADNPQARYKELRRARVIDSKTLRFLRQKIKASKFETKKRTALEQLTGAR